MTAQESGDHHTVTLVAVVPAHDEELRIGDAIEGLRKQTTPPDRIVVVADNCTDRTADVARQHGAEVFESVDNDNKKAGALNQALEPLLEGLPADALILIQDADTVLNPGFAATAIEAMTGDVGAVGGIFFGEQGGGLLGLLQRMEYQRYATEIARKHHEAVVLTGTGTLFRSEVLRQVRQARRDGLIGGGDSYYSLASLTEDDEITKAIKTLGYRTVSPPGCWLVTEVMTSIPKLWNQRRRWERGALENLRTYGWTPVTAPYFRKQVFLALGCLALMCYFLFAILHMTLVGWEGLSLFWTAIMLIFVAERTLTVRQAGPRAVLVAALLWPELIYDAFRQAVFAKSIWNMAMRKKERWEAT